MLAALVAFGRGLGGEFLNFDDPRTVLENPAFAAGWPGGLTQVLDPTRTIAEVYLPVTYLSLWLDVGLWGTSQPLGFHLHSLLLHALAGFALVNLLLDLRFPRSVAVVGSLPFLIPPALAESVVWISSRKDVLSGLFVMLVLWLGWRSVRRRCPPWLVLICVLLAVYSKATALVLPMLALLVWGLDGEAEKRRFWLLWLATTLLCAAAAVHHTWLARAAGTSAFVSEPATVPGALLHYLGLLVMPIDLAVHYPRQSVLAGFASGAGAKTLWLGVVVLAALVLAVRGRGSVRRTGTGVMFALLALLPFNTFKPAFAVGAADRYLYLAVPGLVLALAGLLGAVGPARRRLVALAGAVIVLLGLLPVSFRRSVVFARSDALWTANLEVFPRDTVALVNLAEWHLSSRQGRGPSAARPLLEKAVGGAERAEHRLRVSGQLLRCAVAEGDLEGVAKQAEEAIPVADQLPVDRVQMRIGWRMQFADALERLGRIERAEKVLDEVLHLDDSHAGALASKALHELRRAGNSGAKLPLPASAPSLAKAGRLLERARRGAGAAGSIRLAVATSEWFRLRGETSKAFAALEAFGAGVHEQLFLQRAAVYQTEGLLAEAIRELERGLEKARSSPRLPLSLGSLYLLAGRFAPAEAVLRGLHEDFPDRDDVKRLLAHAIVQQARRSVGRVPAKQLAPLVREAAKLRAGTLGLAYLQAVVLQGEFRLPEALVRVRRAVTERPDDRPARELLLELLKQSGMFELVRKGPEPLAARKKKAFTFFRELVKKAPPGYDLGSIVDVMRGEFEAHLTEANEHLLHGRTKEAEAACRAALSLFPDHDAALLKLGMAHFMAGAWRDAEKSLAESMRAARRSGADPGMALFYRMRALMRLGERSQAARIAEPFLSGAERGKLENGEMRTRIKTLIKKLKVVPR
ncbi:MAG: hypothetical protein CMJ85_13065 [Planctomycetes bacterium]|nr:hypothetical protein [Planctomycetota bacterium]